LALALKGLGLGLGLDGLPGLGLGSAASHLVTSIIHQPCVRTVSPFLLVPQSKKCRGITTVYHGVNMVKNTMVRHGTNALLGLHTIYNGIIACQHGNTMVVTMVYHGVPWYEYTLPWYTMVYITRMIEAL